MSTLQLYDGTDFKGNSVSIHENITDLAHKGFLNTASSLRVTGDPWVVFTGKNFAGEFRVFKEGNYNTIPEFSDKIASVKVVAGGLYDPKITVYEHKDYGGRKATITGPTRSLRAYEMNDMVSSHKVESGCWILYEHDNFQGRKTVTVKGEEIHNYECYGWNDLVSSLKPCDAYVP